MWLCDPASSSLLRGMVVACLLPSTCMHAGLVRRGVKQAGIGISDLDVILTTSSEDGAVDSFEVAAIR